MSSIHFPPNSVQCVQCSYSYATPPLDLALTPFPASFLRQFPGPFPRTFSSQQEGRGGEGRFVNFLPLFSSLFPDICCAQQQFNINIQLLRCCSNGINFCPELKLITSSNLKRVWQVSSSPDVLLLGITIYRARGGARLPC